MAVPLEPSWRRVWRQLGLTPPDGLREKLLAAYGESQRHYHALQHLEECIAHFDGAVDLATQPGEVEIALWFHDAVYDPQGKDNERRSADWAEQVLRDCGAAKAVRQRVHALIMATCHDAEPTDADQRLLVDIDLAILGAPAPRFAQYDQQVRAEYAWVPAFLYRMKRAEILKGFLARQPIYHTEHFRQRYEEQARANLRSVLG